MDNNEIPPQIAYKVGPFAKRVGVSRDTVYSWVAAGEIRSTRVGGTILIPVSELERIAQGSDAA